MLIDVGIVVLFVLYSLVQGLISSRQASKSPEEYFLAGRTLKGWRAGISMAATQYAADTPLLVTGLVATAGIFSLWRLWVYAIAFLLMGFLMGGPWRRASVLTDAEFSELRYGGNGAYWLRIFKAFYLGTLINCTILAMVLLAATRISELFLFWHDWLPAPLFQPFLAFVEQFDWNLSSLPLGSPDVWVRSANNLISICAVVGFTVLYSATGGLRSVVATDLVQFAVIMIATAVYAAMIIFEVGGIRAIPGQLQMIYGDFADRILSFGPPDFGATTLIFLSVLGVQWFAQVNADGSGYLAQRLMACSDPRQARIAAVTFTLAQVLFRSLLWLPIIVGLLILYPDPSLSDPAIANEALLIGREMTFAQGIKDYLPIGLRGLMLTGVLAALASTIDTHLNWGASYWTHDLYKGWLMPMVRRQPANRELVWVARFSNLGILLIALWLMRWLSSIQGAWHLSLLFGSGLGAVLILRWLWYRVNLKAELAAIIVSLIAAPLLLLYMGDAKQEIRLLILTALSIVAVVVTSLVTAPEPREVLVRFYERVRPLGWWGPVARQAGMSETEPRKKFWHRLGGMAACVGSVFCLLIGFGKIAIGTYQMGPDYLAYLMAGFALVPFWLRQLTLRE